MKNLLLLLVIFPCVLFSQTKKQRKALEAQKKEDEVIQQNLKSHFHNLIAGTTGAAEYVTSNLKVAGVKPTGNDGYLQHFNFDDGKSYNQSTSLRVNNQTLKPVENFFPLVYSAQKSITGMPIIALREKGVPWFLNVKDLQDGKIDNVDFNIDKAIQKEAEKVASKGATALFLYNTSGINDSLQFDGKANSTPASIPVIYLTKQGYDKYFSDHSEVLDIELQVAFTEKKVRGTNIIGSIDNGAAHTVVISSYYNSKVEPSTAINAVGKNSNSAIGTSMLIELSKMLAISKAKNDNYMFIVFDGEEQGLEGRDFWFKNNTSTKAFNYLINMESPLIVNPLSKVSVAGYQTAQQWAEIFASVPDKTFEPDLDVQHPVESRFNSFYRNNIPVLTFANDSMDNMPADENMIDWQRELETLKFIRNVIEAADTKGKIAYSSTTGETTTMPINSVPVISSTDDKQDTIAKKDSSFTNSKITKQVSQPASSFSTNTVSLGVIPEKSNQAEGLKILGVSPKKLAAKIGLQAGDILLQLGDYNINDINSYYKALSFFKPGDKTFLKIKRGEDDKVFDVEF